MYFYVYQITNLVNGKIYVGKHKSEVLPAENGYYGSGKLIQLAIEKYGIKNFQKSILFMCGSLNEMSEKEASIVTAEFVLRDDTYNMHKGGDGGFDHINSLPKEERVNVKALRQKIALGEIKVGGTDHWTAESRDKCITQALKNSANGCGKNSWANLPEEHKTKIRVAASMRQSAMNILFNWYINTNNPKERKRLRVEDVPHGWVTITEFNEHRMMNSKRWYNNGIKNFYLKIPNPLVDEFGLVKGRIKQRKP